jgi:transposase
VPALPSWLIEPVWDQFTALLPERHDTHPLGCHRPRIPDRIIFDKLIQVLVFGCAYERIADATCSERTLRRRRDEWITAGIMAGLERIARDAYDRMIGLNLDDLAVDGCITKAPCGGEVAGRSPVDRGKQGLKRSVASDGDGMPLGWVVAPANTHDSPLLGPTLEILAELRPLPTQPTVHLDRGYDSGKTRTTLAERGLDGHIAHKGTPAPIQASKRWPVEHTHAWGNAFGKLRWCTERRRRVVKFYLALAHAVIIVRRLVRRAWTLLPLAGSPRPAPVTVRRQRCSSDAA